MIRDGRSLEGKTCLFSTNGSDSRYKVYDGQLCAVIERIDENSYDFDDVGTMWLVRMPDGKKVEAFADEINWAMSPQEFEEYMRGRNV